MKFDFTLQQLIAYYRECYALDNRQLELYDYYSNQNANRLIIAASRILVEKDFAQKVNFKWGNEVSQKLRVYSKEMELYASSYFFMTNVKILGRNKLSAVPLFLTPLKVEFNIPDYNVSKTTKKTLVNPQAVKSLTVLYPEKTIESIEEKLEEIWRIKDPNKRITALKNNFDTIDYSAFEENKGFLTQSKLKQYLKEKTVNKLLPVVGLGLLNKPTASRGVLSELKDIVLENKFYPEIIESVFLGTNHNITSKKKEVIHVPVNLSVPQQNIIKSAYQNNLTLAVGPPGTGKSFTIASIAVDAIVNGKSVLISSKNDQALKVIAEKLEKDFGWKDGVVLAGEKYFERKIKSRIRNVLSTPVDKEKLRWLRKELKRLEKNISKLDKNIENTKRNIGVKTDYELDLSELILDSSSIIKKLKIFYKQGQQSFSKSLAKEIHSISHLNNVRKEWVKSFLGHSFSKSIIDLVEDELTRLELKKMIQVIESDSGTEKESVFHSINFKNVLKAFPVWLVNMKELNQYLPLKHDEFDLVIIDEATQCDIASTIPLLYRGKRAVVVGDPKQLRHISFLSYEKQNELAEKYGVTDFNKKLLDYRNSSILDVVMETLLSQNQVHYLDEHYRSQPDIIDFSNNEFYNNSLSIMTFNANAENKSSLFVNQCNGVRVNGVNQLEIETLFNQIKTNLELINGRYSVGIISPFANQVKEIQKQVITFFSSEELTKLDLLIGTPYHFQGEERDEVHITFTIDDNTASNVMTYLNREAVFNVAITRSKKRQYIYHSLSSIEFNSHHLFHRYINSIQSIKKDIKQSKTTVDDFANEVTDFLKSKGLKVELGKRLAGVDLDLFVQNKGQLYAIDLVGFPGVFQSTLPIEKYNTLNRMNIKIVVLSFSLWSSELEKSQTTLLQKIGKT